MPVQFSVSPAFKSVVLGTLALSFGLTVAVPSQVFAGQKTDKTITGSVGNYTSTAALSGQIRRSSSVDIAPASATLKRGLKALSRNDMKTALKARRSLRGGSLERKVLAWAIAVDGRGVDAATLAGIEQDLSYWPATDRMRKNIERALVRELDNNSLLVAFSATSPESESAAIAVASAHLASGKNQRARKAIASLWRSSVLDSSTERKILKKFGKTLSRADHRARVEYLLSKKRIRGAERIAGLAGATRLVAARAAVERKQRSATKRLAQVPQFQKTDPNYLFSKARNLRRADRLNEAAKTLLSASPKKIHPNAADLFWTEQRILASDLLEKNAPKTAYRLAARNVAQSKVKRLDAEFYAGWIALRKLGDAGTATRHFSRLLDLAGTPLSKSRGHYWLARAAARTGNSGKANKHLAAAARFDTTYYGQLAKQKLGKRSLSISKARPSRTDRARFPKYELVQAIAKLESAGHRRLARGFYRFLAKHLTKPGELALLAARAERAGDHQLSLQVGKNAFVRGFDVDSLAWPIGAIPRSTRTTGAGLPLAYAVARQESTFQVNARSHANALGLLQLLPTTAKRTARQIGVSYSRRRLVTDAAYNVRLGTAFLGQQMNRFGGSFILTFAAYNAGPGRAADWIKRYGDPRGRSLEFAIDWVEQIPFSETRNYVQRVMENYQVYKTRINGEGLTINRDLRAGTRG